MTTVPMSQGSCDGWRRDVDWAMTPTSDGSDLSLTAVLAHYVKDAIDFMGAVFALVLFGPLMLIIASILVLQNGPVIFAHERIGMNGARFRCLKFRTMAPDAEARLKALLDSDPPAREEWERERKLRNDPRITRVGAFLRETSLDELPQLINVLRGEMSFVGPRPITESELPKYGEDVAYYLKCKPGITGMWQVSGRNNLSYEARVALDSQYARNRSLGLDAIILCKTFGVVLSKTGAR